jgi:hypothetical protein
MLYFIPYFTTTRERLYTRIVGVHLTYRPAQEGNLAYIKSTQEPDEPEKRGISSKSLLDTFRHGILLINRGDLMNIKEHAKKELDTLGRSELLTVYDLILSLKHRPEKTRKSLHTYLSVREALKGCSGSMGDDILSEREDRI